MSTLPITSCYQEFGKLETENTLRKTGLVSTQVILFLALVSNRAVLNDTNTFLLLKLSHTLHVRCQEEL